MVKVVTLTKNDATVRKTAKMDLTKATAMEHVVIPSASTNMIKAAAVSSSHSLPLPQYFGSIPQ